MKIYINHGEIYEVIRMAHACVRCDRLARNIAQSERHRRQACNDARNAIT